MDLYELHSLCQMFYQHAEKQKHMKAEILDRWKDNNPNTEVPEHLLDEFCLPLAFAGMLEEIIQLRKELDELRVSCTQKRCEVI